MTPLISFTTRWWLQLFLIVSVIFHDVTNAFSLLPLSLSRKQHATTHTGSCGLYMVRNIDLPEALIIYGNEVCLSDEDNDSVREGLVNLMNECKETGTAVIVLTNNDNNDDKNTDLQALLPNHCILYPQTVSAPNPTDLIESIASITIQPFAFGGSSGFGSKLPDPERSPEPKYTVVLGTTVDHSRAARAAGMRVVNIDSNSDDPLADAVLFSSGEIDFWLDDIATPGSFWLNPPHPRDDDGNRVDPYEVMQFYEEQDNDTNNMMKNPKETISNDDNDDDLDFDAILADLAPIQK